MNIKKSLIPEKQEPFNQRPLILSQPIPDKKTLLSVREPSRQDILLILNKIVKAGVLMHEERNYLINYINYATVAMKKSKKEELEADSHEDSVIYKQIFKLVGQKLNITQILKPNRQFVKITERRLEELLKAERTVIGGSFRSAKEINEKRSSIVSNGDLKFKLGDLDMYKHPFCPKVNDCVRVELISYLEGKCRKLRLKNAIKDYQVRLNLKDKVANLNDEAYVGQINFANFNTKGSDDLAVLKSDLIKEKTECLSVEGNQEDGNQDSDQNLILINYDEAKVHKLIELLKADKDKGNTDTANPEFTRSMSNNGYTGGNEKVKDSLKEDSLQRISILSVESSRIPNESCENVKSQLIDILSDIENKIQVIENTFLKSEKNKRQKRQTSLDNQFDSSKQLLKGLTPESVIKSFNNSLMLKGLIENVLNCPDKLAKCHLDETITGSSKCLASLLENAIKHSVNDLCEFMLIEFNENWLENIKTSIDKLKLQSKVFHHFKELFELNEEILADDQKMGEFIGSVQTMVGSVTYLEEKIPKLFLPHQSQLDLPFVDYTLESIEIHRFLRDKQVELGQIQTPSKSLEFLMQSFKNSNKLMNLVNQISVKISENVENLDLDQKLQTISNEFCKFEQLQNLLKMHQTDQTLGNWHVRLEKLINDFKILQSESKDLAFENKTLKTRCNSLNNENIQYKDFTTKLVKTYSDANHTTEHSDLLDQAEQAYCQILNMQQLITSLKQNLPELIVNPSDFSINPSELEFIKTSKHTTNLILSNMRDNQTPTIDPTNYLQTLFQHNRTLDNIIKEKLSQPLVETSAEVLNVITSGIISELTESAALKEFLSDKLMAHSNGNLTISVLELIKELETQMQSFEAENSFFTSKFLSYQNEIYTLKHNLALKTRECLELESKKVERKVPDMALRKVEDNYSTNLNLTKSALSDAESFKLKEKSKNLTRLVNQLEAKISKMKVVFDLLDLSPNDKDLLEKVKLRIYELSLNQGSIQSPSPRSKVGFNARNMSISECLSVEDKNVSTLSQPSNEFTGTKEYDINRNSFQNNEISDKDLIIHQHGHGVASVKNANSTGVSMIKDSGSNLVLGDLFTSFSLRK